MIGGGRLVRWLVAALVAGGALFPGAASALGADPAFGTPTAEAAYGEAVTFTVPYTPGDGVVRVELRLGFPDALGPLVVDVAAPRSGGTRDLDYALDLQAGGHLVPNTTIEATWVAYLDAGARSVASRTISVRYQDTGREWRTVSGDLIRVHWYEGGTGFARRALAIGEAAVRDTSALLGVTETEPIDFFIYADPGPFRTALGPGTRENVGGQAHSDIRTLFALITPDAIDDPWVGVVIPHELVHLVFDTAVSNPFRFPPRWLNEGLAVYLSEGYTPTDRRRVERAADEAELIPLTALGGQFPTDSERTFLAYAESVSAIDHLVRAYDRDALVGLVLAYADGLTDDEAFVGALGQDLASFESDWLAELGADSPVRYGPVPAPAGPLPAGWSGPLATAGPGPGSSPGVPTAGPGSPAATSPPGAGDADGGGGSGILILAGAGVVVVVLGGLVIASRRRERAA